MGRSESGLSPFQRVVSIAAVRHRMHQDGYDHVRVTDTDIESFLLALIADLYGQGYSKEEISQALHQQFPPLWYAS